MQQPRRQSRLRLKKPLSEEAELARSRVMRSVANYSRWSRGQRPGRLGLRSRFFDTAGGRTHSEPEDLTVAQMVSVSEYFSISRLFEFIESRLDGSTEMAYQIWEESQGGIETSWERQVQGWSKYASVSIKADPSYTSLSPYIEVRNAVMHGLGSLTRRQQRRAATLVPELARAGISVDGTRVELSRDDVLACRDATVAFIEWLDDQAPL